MENTQFTWRCPSCGEALTLIERTWLCENKHSFDKAKEGYVNLLLAHQKNSKAPGDNNEMVLARRAFLSQDHYLPLAQKIAHIITKGHEQKETEVSIFDAGCGEGYYIRQIQELVQKSGLKVLASGIDISKSAVQKAAKAKAHSQFAVASCYNIPLASASQDYVVQIFAPSSPVEIKRILKPEGKWISVNPASEHLHQMKSIIYDTPQNHDVSEQAQAGFEMVSQERLSFEIQLHNEEQRSNLLKMTPFYWTISNENKLRLMQELQCVQIDFDIKVMQKADMAQN